MNKITQSILGAILVIGTLAYTSFGDPPDTRWYDALTAVLYIGGTWLIWRQNR